MELQMKRSADYFLKKWKTSPVRKPLLLHGARQVGKTYTVREFGKTFTSFVELNLELHPDARELFEHDLDPHRLIQKIFTLTDKPIIPGKTLLFLDEIQLVPNAIIALRYFYEMMPELHVIAAGSLLDFAIQKVGVPVGRVSSFYMYPVSFIEFLQALGAHGTIETILSHDPTQEIEDVFHRKFLDLLGQYLTIGGMPQAVACWASLQKMHTCSEVLYTLIDTYRQDFEKYAQRHQIKYLNALFTAIPNQLGGKFKYSDIEGEYRKRELAPCLDLLLTAGIAHQVTRTAAQGIPLGAQADLHTFKLLLIDVALTQFILGFKTFPSRHGSKDVGEPALRSHERSEGVGGFVNKGELVEAFIGQELLAYEHPTRKAQLYYWQNEVRGGEAEIDYVIQHGEHIVPLEVKSGTGTAMRSMRSFLEKHPNCPYGIRFSTNNYSHYENIHSYPLYAVAHLAASIDDEIKEALLALATLP
jgi:predicted AAA+ superfamily ATPase